MSKRTILTISGPSLSGKSTLARYLNALPEFQEVISHTTRLPREGEVNGVDYHFVSEDVFRDIPMIGGTRINFANYGTSVNEIMGKLLLKPHVIPFAVVDPNGARAWRDFAEFKELRHVAVWLDVDSETQILRWMDRVASETDIAVVKKHLERLYTMMNDERAWWSGFDWDFDFPEFNEYSEGTVLEQIGLICGVTDPAPWPTSRYAT